MCFCNGLGPKTHYLKKKKSTLHYNENHLVFPATGRYLMSKWEHVRNCPGPFEVMVAIPRASWNKVLSLGLPFSMVFMLGRKYEAADPSLVCPSDNCNSQQRSKHNPCPNQIFCMSQRHYWKRDKAKGESHCDEEAPLFIQKDHCKLIGCKINITRVIWGILLHYVHVAGVKLVLLVFDYLTRSIGCTMSAHVYPQSRWGSV